MNGVLVLEDGTVVRGRGFGGEGEARGEVVFNTSMTGYQEYLTDPSYKYQILMPTYPLIGNYGISSEWFESDRIQVEGFVVRELCREPSHGRMEKRLDTWLEEEGIPGLEGVDTRFLTKKIREAGVMNGILKVPYEEGEIEELKEEVRRMQSISDVDLVEIVSVKKPVVHQGEKANKTVVMIDCGVKMSIIRSLVRRGCRVIRVPARAKREEILGYNPDGIMVSNGPGDPKRAGYIVDTIKEIIGEEIPLFGICFGNQLVGRALGGDTYKLRFGHRGGNQPVKDVQTGRVYITAQNHGFALDAESLGDEVDVTHINLNDKSVEGIKHKSLPIFTVQYHPEAHPGPWDSDYLFDEFISLMERRGGSKR